MCYREEMNFRIRNMQDRRQHERRKSILPVHLRREDLDRRSNHERRTKAERRNIRVIIKDSE